MAGKGGGPGGYPGTSKRERDGGNMDVMGYKLPPQHLRGDIPGAGGQGVAPGESMDQRSESKDVSGQSLPSLTTPGTKSGPKKGDND